MTVDPYYAEKERFDRAYFHRLLKHCNGNMNQVAKLAARERGRLYKVIAKLGLDINSYRPESQKRGPCPSLGHVVDPGSVNRTVAHVPALDSDDLQ